MLCLNKSSWQLCSGQLPAVPWVLNTASSCPGTRGVLVVSPACCRAAAHPGRCCKACPETYF